MQHEGEVHVCPDPFHTSTERGREVMSMVERQQRPHGVEAAGAGDLGKVSSGMEFGPCPGCGAELRTMQITDPHTNRAARALAHPTPFCTYFGETDSTVIERAVTAARAS